MKRAALILAVGLWLPSTAGAHLLTVAQAREKAQTVAERNAARFKEPPMTSIIWCRRRAVHSVDCRARYSFGLESVLCEQTIRVRYRNGGRRRYAEYPALPACRPD